MKCFLDFLYDGVRENPDRVVFNFLDYSEEPHGTNPITVRQLYDGSRNMAATLKKRGAKKDDRVIIFSLQDEGTIYAILGCMMAGVVFTVIPPPIDDDKLGRFISVLKSLQPKFLISNYAMEQASERDIASPLLKKAFLQVINLRRIYTDQLTEADGHFAPEDSLANQAEDDLVYIQYTSGSTSEPKGVMVTSKNLLSCIAGCKEAFDFDSGNNVVSWVPFYHNIGLVFTIFIGIAARQGTVYLIHTLQFLQNPASWLKAISDYKVNVTIAPNSAYEACAGLISSKDAQKYDLSHVELLINGSEIINPLTVEKFSKLFGIPEKTFAAGYGLSECVCVASFSPKSFKSQRIDLDEYMAGRFAITEGGSHKSVVSLGLPLRDLKIVIAKDDGSPCAGDEIGEIYIQGSGVSKGYWKNQKDTEQFYASIAGHDGSFLRTGDMGVVFEGELYITGRIKEMIIVNGNNIFPNDIALLLQKSCPALAGSAMGAFSVLNNGREEPVICLESDEVDFGQLALDVNRAVSQAYNFSFGNIVFVRKKSLPLTDNRKVRIGEVKRLYESCELDIVFSTRPLASNDTSVPPDPLSLSGRLSVGASADEVKIFVRSVFESYIGHEDFDDRIPFVDMGTDSLTVIDMLGTLEQLSGTEIDVRFVDADLTVNGLARYIFLTLQGENPGKTDFSKESILEDDIRPLSAYTVEPESCRKIFLTGSTGFLGAHLIRSLICRSKYKRVKIYCLARADSRHRAMDRIVENMKFFGCWDERFRRRIRAVHGDLNKPWLGMDERRYRRLSKKTEMVVHNGAILNFLFSYSQLKQTNVSGTAECLRFACAGNPKYFHFVSSYSVYDNPSHFGKSGLESDPLVSPEGYFLGYSETKWVAEKLVEEAESRGLRVSVYRPGEITGSTETGIWKMEDMISRTIVGCIQMGAAPDVDIQLPLTPVDFVSDAIACIAFQKEATGKRFNLTNETVSNIRAMGEYIAKAGYSIETLPYDEWTGRLGAYSVDENALGLLARLFTDASAEGEGLLDRYGDRQAAIDTSNTRRLLEGSGITCPPLSEAAFLKYLEFFIKVGYLERP